MSVRNRLHDIDPYNNFDHLKYDLDISGWNSEHSFFEEVCSDKCKLVFEVGSWKGASAIRMSELLKKHGSNFEVVCIDTWLGALEFWTNNKNIPHSHLDPERYLSLNLSFGYPTVYYQFLANVVYCNCKEYITPFPQTSSIAARWLAMESFFADLIYLDCSHGYLDVCGDLRSYWNVLSEGGVMFGDDYVSSTFPGVRKAVDEFSKEFEISCSVVDRFWSFRKPELI